MRSVGQKQYNMKKIYHTPAIKVREVKIQRILAGTLQTKIASDQGFNETGYEGGYAKSSSFMSFTDGFSDE